MAAGHYREAGRLALEAADEIRTPQEADQIEALAEAGMEMCSFVQRGRFESVLELVQERRAQPRARPRRSRSDPSGTPHRLAGCPTSYRSSPPPASLRTRGSGGSPFPTVTTARAWAAARPV